MHIRALLGKTLISIPDLAQLLDLLKKLKLKTVLADTLDTLLRRDLDEESQVRVKEVLVQGLEPLSAALDRAESDSRQEITVTDNDLTVLQAGDDLTVKMMGPISSEQELKALDRRMPLLGQGTPYQTTDKIIGRLFGHMRRKAEILEVILEHISLGRRARAVKTLKDDEYSLVFHIITLISIT